MRLDNGMNTWLRMNEWLCAGFVMTTLIGLIGGVSAEAANNPFAVIVEKNVFRLQPFPVPTHLVEKTPAPPKNLPKVVITGITDVCGRRQVLAEVTEPGKPTVRPVLAEGESYAGLEILGIDLGRTRVRVSVLGERSELELQAARPAVPASGPPPPLPALAVRR